MENLPLEWDTIQGYLQGIQGFDPKVVKRYHEEGAGRGGIHFFLIRYDPGEVIMAKGTSSDYAALHLQGVIRVQDIAPPARATGRGCWALPLERRLEDLVLREAALTGAAPRGRLRFVGALLAPFYRRSPGMLLRLVDVCEHWGAPRLAAALRRHVAAVLYGRMSKVRRVERELSHPAGLSGEPSTTSSPTPSDRLLTIRDDAGQDKPLEDRFLAITSTLWNQPRGVTLVANIDRAAGDKPCELLLIKRKALEEIIKRNPGFYQRKMADFVATALPDVLARNHLFRARLFIEDVRDWDALLSALQDKTANAALRRLRERLDKNLTRWLGTATALRLDQPEKSQIIEKINQVLTLRELALADAWPGVAVGVEGRELLRQPHAGLNDCEVYRINRLLLEAALPGVLQESPRPYPLSREDFRAFGRDLSEGHLQKFGKPLQPERFESKDKKKKGVVVFQQGDPADSIYLILSGLVRVSMDLAGGRTMVNNLEAGAYFGESAVLADGEGAEMPRRSAGVETLCATTLLRLDRDVLRAMFAGPYLALGDKLKHERALLSARDEQARTGRLLPPSEPPLQIAERLVLTRNALLIDMNKCTRCDQCVRGCAEAHDLQPRFHRANPELRFGKWEVAGACLNCLDAPCQAVCPVGAITFLEDAAVQIHRDRCIGCSQCANDCPFGVIDMYPPHSPADAPSSKKGIVANKCDLCLTQEHDPPCVACCPYDAARRVDPVEFFPELKGWANFPDRQ
jgi:Fe-S-cluster-containing hydrogenase component 2/CRP-like cAMP-binding protein